MGLNVGEVEPGSTAWGLGAAQFVSELQCFADACATVPLDDVMDVLCRPLKVAVVGRPGVGRRTVAAALRACDVPVLAADAAMPADLTVLVVAEALKPEDEDLLAGPDPPALIVLNKADVTGSAPGGPLAAAAARAGALVRATGLPVVPAVGLLARLDALEGEEVTALRTMAEVPADLGSVDGFVASEHPVGRAIRERLLARLDRFGVAHAVLALAKGVAPREVEAQLRELGNVDAVMSALQRAAAPVRFRAAHRAVRRLRWLATYSDAATASVLDEFLVGDDLALALMAAAVDVVEAVGAAVDRADSAEAHRGRALRWDGYARGPVDELHRACAHDIVRGSLRLLQRRSAR